MQCNSSRVPAEGPVWHTLKCDRFIVRSKLDPVSNSLFCMLNSLWCKRLTVQCCYFRGLILDIYSKQKCMSSHSLLVFAFNQISSMFCLQSWCVAFRRGASLTLQRGRGLQVDPYSLLAISLNNSHYGSDLDLSCIWPLPKRDWMNGFSFKNKKKVSRLKPSKYEIKS